MDFDFEFDLDFIKNLISDFDLMAILPQMADVMDWIVTGVSYAVVIGPILLAIMGLWYLILPAREANHFLGYRFFWGMGSVKSWKFTQRFAGLVWAVLGLILALDANELREQLPDTETLEAMYQAIELIINQIFWVVVASVTVNVIIFLLFNFKGQYRWLWRYLGDAIKGALPKKQPKPEKKKRERKTKPAELVQNIEEPIQTTTEPVQNNPEIQ